MSTLIINDLPENTELDRAAIAAILGGYRSGFGFLRVHRNLSGSGASAGGMPSLSIYEVTNTYVTNNFIDFDYNVIQQNPTNFHVHNGAGNSGTITNNFETLSLSASSPVLLQNGS